MYDFYTENHGYLADTMKKVALQLSYNKDTLPKYLNSSMQAPLTTPWWSISVLAIEFPNFMQGRSKMTIYYQTMGSWRNDPNKNIFYKVISGSYQNATRTSTKTLPESY